MSTYQYYKPVVSTIQLIDEIFAGLAIESDYINTIEENIIIFLPVVLDTDQKNMLDIIVANHVPSGAYEEDGITLEDLSEALTDLIESGSGGIGEIPKFSVTKSTSTGISYHPSIITEWANPAFEDNEYYSFDSRSGILTFNKGADYLVTLGGATRWAYNSNWRESSKIFMELGYSGNWTSVPDLDIHLYNRMRNYRYDMSRDSGSKAKIMHIREGHQIRVCANTEYYSGIEIIANSLNLEIFPLITGSKGDKGDKGETGNTGLKGDSGTNGRDGVDGRDGTNGTNGSDGRDGANGIDGRDGVDGTNGIDGTNGLDGVKGDKGDTGERGESFRIDEVTPFDEANVTRIESISTITSQDVYFIVVSNDTRSNQTAPVSGDMSGHLLMFDGTSWYDNGQFTGIKGDKGDAGNDGLPGADGRDGTNGTNGANGRDGAKGDKGDAGRDGTNGTDGRDGTNGTNGTNGIDGRDGNDGDKGEKGDQGERGYTGLKGDKGDKGEKGESGDSGFSDTYEYHSNESTVTTTSISYIDHLNIMTEPLATGALYRIGWQYQWNFDHTGSDFIAQVLVDGHVVEDIRVEPKDSGGSHLSTGSDQKNKISGFVAVTGNGTCETIKIRFASGKNRTKASMWSSRLEIQRVK